MKPRNLLLLIPTVCVVACAAAWAAERTYYRACCTTEPERHGCGISSWYDSENAAHEAGTRHARMTSGHAWTVESTTR